jgi:molybdate transport system substrate-binding protein
MIRKLQIFLLCLSLFGFAQAETLKVFAAASLKESFEAIADQYKKDNPGEEVELNFAGSQVLKRQIQEGAPADVFASADHVNMDELKKAGFAADDKVFARNLLAVVVPKDSKITSLGGLVRPGVKIVVADGNVPVGRYTSSVLGRMGKAGVYGDDFQKRVQDNTVSRETSVRNVLMKVVLGEADAGFVYVTDAATALDKVRVLNIPEDVNAVASYPIAVLKKSASPDNARKFVALVLGERGQAVLKGRGFLPPK